MKLLLLTTVLFVLKQECMSADTIRFLVNGDWGGVPYFPYWTVSQQFVSCQMKIYAKRYDAQFILSLGDNFYWEGVTDVHDKRFKKTFEQVYDSPYLNIPWYILAGNHDHVANISAQIAYSDMSSRWNFPNYYYKQSMNVPNSDATLDILMLDTVILCVNDGIFGTSVDRSLTEQQWSWIETELQNSVATYLLLAGHFPVYSIGTDGPTRCLTDRLLPLLHTYKVSAYLAGHDHNLQHLQSEQNAVVVDLFIVGAGKSPDPAQPHTDSVPPGASKFFWGNILKFGGFAYVEVDSSQMTVTMVDAVGETLYTANVSPRQG